MEDLVEISEAQLKLALENGERIGPPSGGEVHFIEAYKLRSALLDKSIHIGPSGLALNGVHIKGSLNLADADLPRFELRRCHFEGPVDMSGARFRGALLMEGSYIAAADSDGYSLRATALTVSGSLRISDPKLTANLPFRSFGAVYISGRVEGTCVLRGACIFNPCHNQGFAVLLDQLTTTGPLYAEKLRLTGALSIVSAKIGDQVNISESRIQGETLELYSVQLDSISTRGPLYALNLQLSAGMSLTSAKIGGDLVLDSSRMGGVGTSGYAIAGDSGEFEGQVSLQKCDLIGGITWELAKAERRMDLGGLRINSRGAVLNFTAAALGRLIVGASIGESVVLQLDGAKVDRLELSSVPAEAPILGQLTTWKIESLIGGVVETRTAISAWMSTSGHSRQAWYQVASLLEQVGRRSDATWVRFRAEQLSTASARASRRYGKWVAGLVSEWVTGYGYYPLRTVFTLLLLVAASTGLAIVAEPTFATPATGDIRFFLADPATPSRVYTGPPTISASSCVEGTIPIGCFSPLQYGVSSALPVVNLVQVWTSLNGGVAVAFGIFRALSWILTALLAAGITGLLRKRG